MIGEFLVEIKNADVAYKFILKRNITVLKGEGASGKTLLYDLVDIFNNSDQKGVTVRVTGGASIETLNRQRFNDGVLLTRSKQNRIFIIDEDSNFVNSNDFAVQAINSGFYFILINRDKLDQLSCSIHEIYQLKQTHDRFIEFIPLYPNDSYGNIKLHHKVVTEDKGAGRQFFSRYDSSLDVEGADGRSDIIHHVPAMEPTLVVADGAAFGFNMATTLPLVQEADGGLIVKESFEYVILKSGIVHSKDSRMLTLDKPAVDSRLYFSWEQYYTELLCGVTAGTPLAYKKEHLPQEYSNPVAAEAILHVYGLNSVDAEKTKFFK